jgi:hypothetical protein
MTPRGRAVFEHIDSVNDARFTPSLFYYVSWVNLPSDYYSLWKDIDVHECGWCGETGPLTEEVNGLEVTWTVQLFEAEYGHPQPTDGWFHKSCHDRQVAYRKVSDALKATGWTRAMFMMNVSLLADELSEPCIHPGVFATGPVPGTEHCYYCNQDVPRSEL